MAIVGVTVIQCVQNVERVTLTLLAWTVMAGYVLACSAVGSGGFVETIVASRDGNAPGMTCQGRDGDSLQPSASREPDAHHEIAHVRERIDGD
jgi:hypothetical protein